MKKSAYNKKELEERRQMRLVKELLVLFLLTAGCIIFEILTFKQVREGFVARNAPWLIALSALLTVTALAVAVTFLVRKKEKVFKSFVTAFFMLFLLLIITYVVFKTDLIVILQSPELYQKFLEDTGAWMPVLYIVLQFLQVVLLPIPSIVSTLAGIALFGPLKTAIFSLIGILLGSFLAFFIGRKLGYKAVAWLVGEEELKSWLKKIKGKDSLVLTAMFILPLFPDDILCFVAGLTTMTAKYFTGMIFLSRVISIVTTCYSVDLIPLNQWWGIVLWGLIFAVAIVGFIILYKNMDRINKWLKDRKKRKKNKKSIR